MPIANIQIMEGRTSEKIEALMKNVTETISISLDVPIENVRVLIHEVPKTHWSIGGVSANNLKR